MPAWDDYTWTFDVQLKGDPTWVPYTWANFPDATEFDENLGPQHSWEPGDIAEQHHERLTEAAGPIRAQVGPEMTGLRIQVWQGTEAEGAPALTREATPAELVAACVYDHELEVERAHENLAEQKYSLRACLVEAFCEGRIGPTAEEALKPLRYTKGNGGSEDLVPMLEAARPIHQLRQELTRDGYLPINPGCNASEYWGESLPTGDIFWWSDPIRFQISPDGTSTVRIDTHAGGWGLNLPPGADEVEQQWAEQERRGRAKRALNVARDLLPRLERFHLQAVDTDTGRPVDAQRLAEGVTHPLVAAETHG